MTASIPFMYHVYGVTLVSEIRLTLPQVLAHGANKIVVLTTKGTEDFHLMPKDMVLDPDEWFQQTVFEDGKLYMRWKDWFDFLISSDGRRVLCRNLSDRTLDSFEAYLTNFAVSAALVQQGEETLHATVVDIGGRAVGLLGASGAGKSTLASFLSSRGGDIVTDDMLRVTIDIETALAHPGPHRLKLSREPAELFLPDTPSCGSWSPLGDKMIYNLGDPTKIRSSCRLTALYQLRAPDEPENKRVLLKRLTGLDLFETICSSTMNNRLKNPARLERHFQFAERLANILPIYRLTYPRTFNALEEVAENIYTSAPT